MGEYRIMPTKIGNFEKPEIRLEHLVDGSWGIYHWLVPGSDKVGHYGAAKDAWDHANMLVRLYPEK